MKKRGLKTTLTLKIGWIFLKLWYCNRILNDLRPKTQEFDILPVWTELSSLLQLCIYPLWSLLLQSLQHFVHCGFGNSLSDEQSSKKNEPKQRWYYSNVIKKMHIHMGNPSNQTFCWTPITNCRHSASRDRGSFALRSRVRPLICSSNSRFSRLWIRHPNTAQSGRPTKRRFRECWVSFFSASRKR